MMMRWIIRRVPLSIRLHILAWWMSGAFSESEKANLLSVLLELGRDRQ